MYIYTLTAFSLQSTAFKGPVFSDGYVQLWMFSLYVQMPVCIVFLYVYSIDYGEESYLCRKVFVLTNEGWRILL